jgi:dihydroflavonol-4-reductase
VRALVTGAAGFIGGHVAQALHDAGWEVRAFDRELGGSSSVGEPVVGDVLDAAAVQRAAEGSDAIFHLAALYSYARRDAAAMLRVNVEGTRAVLDAAARTGTRRVVMTSSCATCGPVPGRAATEEDQPPAWELGIAYKRSKIDSEKLALRAARDGLDVVVVNPTTPVGPGDARPTPTGAMVAGVASGRIRAFTQTAINVVAVQDVAAGHLLAHEHGRRGERYLLGGEDVTLREAFAMIARHAGRVPPRVAVPYPVALGAAWAADRATRLVGREPRLLNLDETRLARVPMRFSCVKAQRELGYVFRPADEALAGAVEWFLAARSRGDSSPLTATA